MPWKACPLMTERQEFLALALLEGSNISSLSDRFGVSRKTGYKWIRRAREGYPGSLEDRFRRPHSYPTRTSSREERAVLSVRSKHPSWGGRKIRQVLLRGRTNEDAVPSASTITAILRRHGQIDPAESQKHEPLKRFEHAAPNDLWQMDFKGHFPMSNARRCHPLTILDDPFDRWRDVYNLERPHEALDLEVPASRHAPSSRVFPESLAPIEYGPGDIVRKVQGGGVPHYRGIAPQGRQGVPRPASGVAPAYRRAPGRVLPPMDPEDRRTGRGAPEAIGCGGAGLRNPLGQGTP